MFVSDFRAETEKGLSRKHIIEGINILCKFRKVVQWNPSKPELLKTGNPSN